MIIYSFRMKNINWKIGVCYLLLINRIPVYFEVVEVAVAVIVDVEVDKRNSLASLKDFGSSLGNTESADLKYQILFFIDDVWLINLPKKNSH